MLVIKLGKEGLAEILSSTVIIHNIPNLSSVRRLFDLEGINASHFRYLNRDVLCNIAQYIAY